MRINVVADVHGNVEALEKVAAYAGQLVILGDLLDYVDYHDPSRGMLSEVFGEDAVRRFTLMRSRGEFRALHRFNAELWGSLSDPVGVVTGMVQDRYRSIVRILPDDAVVTLGNVDVVAEWRTVAGDAFPCRDSEVIDIAGVRFGFVAGGVRRAAPPTSSAIRPGGDGPAQAPATPWQPYIRPRDEYARAVASLGDADVLCSHIPPAAPILRYDTVPGRVEMVGPGLVEYIERVRPAMSLFGHVHQPLSRRRRIAMTECVNVGHFQRTEVPFVLESDRIAAGLGPRHRTVVGGR